MSHCGICGKPLTDPISIELGVGPVCRLSLKLQEAKNMTGNLFNPRSDYTYEIDGNIVCIVDHDNGKSVTNDVDEVLAEIAGDGVDLCKHRVIYRDTMGVWDEIVLKKDGGFKAFKSINERELSAALAKVRAAAQG